SRQNRRESCLVLDASLGVFVFHDEEGLLRLDAEQLTCGKLMIQPVHRAILQVRERIVARSARQLVLTEDRLLLPGILLFGVIDARALPVPVAALHRLATVAPRRDTPGIDDLAFDVKAGDEKVVAGVFEVLKYRARVLTHENRVRGVIVDAELLTDAV